MKIIPVDIKPQKPDPDSFVRPYPYRSPLIVAEVVKDLIQDKTVCDVGCGEGDVLMAMKPYAKSVVGFERKPERYQQAIDRGLDVVVGDWDEVPLPDVQVYYSWGPTPDSNVVIANLVFDRPSFEMVIVGGRKDALHLKWLHERYPHMYILEFPFHEDSVLDNWKSEDVFWLGVVDGRNLDV